MKKLLIILPLLLLACKKEEKTQQTPPIPDCQTNNYGWIHFHACTGGGLTLAVYAYNGIEYGPGNPLRIIVPANNSLQDSIVKLRQGTWNWGYFDPSIAWYNYDKVFYVAQCDTGYQYICN